MDKLKTHIKIKKISKIVQVAHIAQDETMLLQSNTRKIKN